MTETEACKLVALIETKGIINIVASVRPRIVINDADEETLAYWDGGNIYGDRWEIQDRRHIRPLLYAIQKYSTDVILQEQARTALSLIETDEAKGEGYREKLAELAEKMERLTKQRKVERMKME